MRLVILGSGTCVPSPDRIPSGYWVEAGALKIRLDCGAGTVPAMGRYGLAWEGLTHQVISHFHLDHVGELPALLFALKHGREGKRALPLEIVGPAGLESLTRRLAEVHGTRILDQEFPVVFREPAPASVLDLGGGVRLSVAKTPHTDESLAVRIDAEGRSLGYTGDTLPSDDLAVFFRGVDLLLAECSFLDDARGTPHLTADGAADLAAAAGVKHLVATHFYFDPGTVRLAERLSRRFPGRITIATDGLAIDV